MSLGLGEAQQNETINARKFTILVFLQDNSFDGAVFDDDLLLRFLKTKILEVKALLNGFITFLSSLSLGLCCLLLSFSSGSLCLGFSFLLIDVGLFLLFVPFIVSRTVLFGRWWTLSAQRNT